MKGQLFSLRRNHCSRRIFAAAYMDGKQWGVGFTVATAFGVIVTVQFGPLELQFGRY